MKSPEEVELVTATMIMTVCEIEPADPVTVTVYVPTGVVDEVATSNVEVPVPPDERAMLVCVRLTFRPVGETNAERFTVPANPSTLARVTIEEAVKP